MVVFKKEVAPFHKSKNKNAPFFPIRWNKFIYQTLVGYKVGTRNPKPNKTKPPKRSSSSSKFNNRWIRLKTLITVKIFRRLKTVHHFGWQRWMANFVFSSRHLQHDILASVSRPFEIPASPTSHLNSSINIVHHSNREFKLDACFDMFRWWSPLVSSACYWLEVKPRRINPQNFPVIRVLFSRFVDGITSSCYTDIYWHRSGCHNTFRWPRKSDVPK
jgi:hypothetical protein